MNTYQIILLIFAVVSGIILLCGLYKTKRRGVLFFKSALLGIVAFAAVAFLGQYAGVYIGINLQSLLCAVILGVPGVGLMAIINFL